MFSRMRKAFTLIELLIVVAIIAILAAIAVPNFLEAQVRSKVSAVKTNLRTCQVALESYFVDTNHVPLCTQNPFPAPPTGAFALNERWKFYPGYPGAGKPGGLTTPIAYISSATAMTDIFRKAHNFTSVLANQIMYLPSEFYRPGTAPWYSTGQQNGDAAQQRRYGAYVLRSAGPDTWYQNQSGMNGDYDDGGWGLQSYDATNGTVSAGDIYRSQKSSDESHI